MTAGQEQEPDTPPRVTVAIVTKNAADTIEMTLNSVVSQDYSDLEIIVVDGMSTDATASIINNFADRISLFIRELDAGVYFAMNKAANVATGDFLIYMNSGDVFYNTSAVSGVFSDTSNIDCDIIVCKYVLRDKLNSRVVSPLRYDTRIQMIREGRYFDALSRLACHQATITRRISLLSAGMYDTSFSILADQNFLFQSSNEGLRFLYCDNILCKYETGGLSSDRNKSDDEMQRIVIENGADPDLAASYFTKSSMRRLVNEMLYFISSSKYFRILIRALRVFST